jgi:hypothetical protein
LENYAAHYSYPEEVANRLGIDITVALFPASFVGWKLAYFPVPDSHDSSSFTHSLAVEKLEFPADLDVEQSFVALSRTSSTTENDTFSLASDDSASTISLGGREESEDEYIVIGPSTPRATRREAVPMERGNGPLSPSESVCDIADMKPEADTGAVEMLPGRKMIEKKDGLLSVLDRGLFGAGTDGLKESFTNAREYLRRDGTGWSKFAKQLDTWSSLLGERASS